MPAVYCVGDFVKTIAGLAFVTRITDRVEVLTPEGCRMFYTQEQIEYSPTWLYSPFVGTDAGPWSGIGQPIPKEDAKHVAWAFDKRQDKQTLQKRADDYLHSLGFVPKHGGSRTTYIRPDVATVIKVSRATINCNLVEYLFAQYNAIGIPVAPSRLIDIEGVPCIEMEKVAVVHDHDAPQSAAQLLNAQFPWIQLVDSYQVGHTRDNCLVAFDLSDYHEFALEENANKGAVLNANSSESGR